jgi:hypothetical protein
MSYASNRIRASTESKQVNPITRLPNADNCGVAVHDPRCEARADHLLETFPDAAPKSDHGGSGCSDPSYIKSYLAVRI